MATMNQSSDIGTVPGCVTVLAEAFGKKTSHGMFEAYRLGLRGLSSEQVQAATQSALERCRFMPAPAELRDMVYLRPEDRAVKAWLAFGAAVTQYGYIASVTFDDPIINAAIRALGGWQHVCSMPASEFDAFLPKRFEATYCSLARSGVSGEQSAPLLGWIDQSNQLNGHSSQPVALIDTGMPAKPLPRIHEKRERPAELPRLELKKA